MFLFYNYESDSFVSLVNMPVCKYVSQYKLKTRQDKICTKTSMLNNILING